MYCYIHEDTGPSNSLRSTRNFAHAKASLLPRKVDPALRRCKIVSHYPIYAICFQYTVFKEHSHASRLHNVHDYQRTLPIYEEGFQYETETITIQLRIAQWELNSRIAFLEFAVTLGSALAFENETRYRSTCERIPCELITLGSALSNREERHSGPGLPKWHPDWRTSFLWQ